MADSLYGSDDSGPTIGTSADLGGTPSDQLGYQSLIAKLLKELEKKQSGGGGMGGMGSLMGLFGGMGGGGGE